jgi:hypothetical protein
MLKKQEPDPLHPGVLPPSLISIGEGYAYPVYHPGGPPPFSYLPGHWRLSVLVALNKDGPGQCSEYSPAAKPRTCGPWKVNVNIVLYSSSSNTVFWNAFPNGYLHSTDCCYNFRFN